MTSQEASTPENPPLADCSNTSDNRVNTDESHSTSPVCHHSPVDPTDDATPENPSSTHDSTPESPSSTHNSASSSRTRRTAATEQITHPELSEANRHILALQEKMGAYNLAITELTFNNGDTKTIAILKTEYARCTVQRDWLVAFGRPFWFSGP